MVDRCPKSKYILRDGGKTTMTLHTLKGKITFVTVVFTLIITLLVATFSFYLFRSFAIQSQITSTEFNLQFIGARAREKMVAIDSLVKWSTTNAQVTAYLEQTGNRMALTTYDRVKEEVMNNLAQAYVNRIIITDLNHTKLIHTGMTMSESKPVTVSNVSHVLPATFVQNEGWNAMGSDPFMIDPQIQVLPIQRVITKSSSTEVTGQLYLSISANLILDLIEDYAISEGSSLYLTIGNFFYEIRKDQFMLIDTPHTTEESYETAGENTRVYAAKINGHDEQLLVTCPTGYQDIALSQSIPIGKITFERQLYLSLLGTITVAVIIFGLGLTMLLNKLINKPVAKIKERVHAISQSDFSNDPSIEWNDELGDIGKGINHLSSQISSLLETRVSDEKKKQELEYRMLQSQINPHFLYNTLNSIKWMATLQQATGIAEMTTSLARLMKNLSKADAPIISLEDELALLSDYFVIQKYRYGGTLVLTDSISKEFYTIGIPRFTLQPLVENAIFHGIEPKGGAGNVTLSAKDLGTCIEISILDDGVGMNAEKIDSVFSSSTTPTSGMFREIGIRNVHKRIQYTFGEEYGLTLQSEEGLYTLATLKLPKRTKGGEAWQSN